jgi:hypothetical protein
LDRRLGSLRKDSRAERASFNIAGWLRATVSSKWWRWQSTCRAASLMWREGLVGPWSVLTISTTSVFMALAAMSSSAWSRENGDLQEGGV